VEKAPPLFQTNQHRAAACYLYQDHSSIRPEEMDKVFVRRTAPSKMRAGQPPAVALRWAQDVAWQMLGDASRTNAGT
jgi:hypothetical protein